MNGFVEFPVAPNGGDSIQGALRMTADNSKQLLHLVFGGELEDVSGITFKDLDKLEFVGVFPNYASAYKAWKAKAQRTIDHAQTRYFIVHLHRLLEPEDEE
jgi:hypothetical protein